jgi:hypothetical protein
MKKSLIFIVSLFICLYIGYVSYADEYGTEVEFVASNQSEYSITVPAKLTPKTGQSVSGTVSLSGRWASNETVEITADESVVLANSLNPLNTRELDITLSDMSYSGNDTSASSYTGTVTISAMPNDILFGTWTGKFNYNVEVINEVIFQVDEYYYVAENGMTFREFVNSEYNTGIDINGNQHEKLIVVEDSWPYVTYTSQPAVLHYYGQYGLDILSPDVVITDGFSCFIFAG